MERAEGFSVIRGYRSDGYDRPEIIKMLKLEGVPQSTAYDWFKKLDALESIDDAVEAASEVIRRALLNEDNELVLKAAAVKGKLLR